MSPKLKFTAYKNTQEKKSLDFLFHIRKKECYDEPFTFDELLKCLYDTAIGLDQIHYQNSKTSPKQELGMSFANFQ